MMHDKFQMFGIHVYLQDPNKLTCLAVTSAQIDKVTTSSSVDFTKRPHRTVISGMDVDKSVGSKNYEIDAFEYNSSANYQRHSKSVILVLPFVISIYMLNLNRT